MKKTLLISSIIFAINSFSQPIILNGNNIPAPGLAASVFSGTSALGVGASGANQTWNFSAVSFSTLGTMNTINPSASTFSASFPTATYAYSFAGTYSYFNSSATKMEALAYSITSPGSGNDLTPNPRTVLKFPFNFNDAQADTWQKVGGSVSNVTITYDGYGTLITPTTTYSNVVRVKEDYGTSIDYQWYILSPLMNILSYNNASNTFYLTGATATTGINDQNTFQMSIDFYPNPVKDKLVIQISYFAIKSNLKLHLLNVVGQLIIQASVDSQLTTIELNNFSGGIYYYQLLDEHNILKTGKIIVE